ncbi:hypothetical protein GX411_08115 [Candidatus Fermentibacteria bacterium]|nr:hypothetical protein [Candidatus Fermentibacteria bacterium]
MAYELVKEEGTRRTIRFTADAGDVDELFRKIRKRINSELRIPGFRPGHVPRAMLDSRFGNLIRTEVAEEMRERLQNSLLEERDWILAGIPVPDDALPAEGSGYSFEITFDLFETPEPVGYDSFEVTIPRLDEEKSLEAALQSIRERMTGFETVDRPARRGDMVLVDAVGVEDAGSREPEHMALRLGDDGLGAGLDDLFVGLSKGASFTARTEPFDPPASGDAPETGRPTLFKLVDVREPVLPELTDELASKASRFSTVAELRESLRERIRLRYESERADLIESQVMTRLLDRNPFDPPAYMIENLKGDLIRDLEREPDEETRAFAGEVARRRVREFLILRAVALREGLEPGEDELAEEAGRTGSRASALDRLRNRKALRFLLDRAAVTETDPVPGESAGPPDGKPAWIWRRTPPPEGGAVERQG